MPRINFSRVKPLYGKPIEGYVVYGHPDKMELRKGYVYYKEYEHESGPVSEFINKIKEAVENFLNSLKSKDGSPAGELVYIGTSEVTIGGETKTRAHVQFKITKDIDHIEADEETLRLMGVSPQFPIIPVIALLIGGIIGFFLGMAVAISLIVVGLLIGGDLGAALVSMGLGILMFSVTSGWYKALSIPMFGASAYFLARFFGMIK